MKLGEHGGVHRPSTSRRQSPDERGANPNRSTEAVYAFIFAACVLLALFLLTS